MTPWNQEVQYNSRSFEGASPSAFSERMFIAENLTFVPLKYISQKFPYNFSKFLDRHQVWRSHDPTSVQTFDFCEKKAVIPPFLKIDATFCCLHLFLSHLLKRCNFTTWSSSSRLSSYRLSFSWLSSSWLSTRLYDASQSD